MVVSEWHVINWHAFYMFASPVYLLGYVPPHAR